MCKGRLPKSRGGGGGGGYTNPPFWLTISSSIELPELKDGQCFWAPITKEVVTITKEVATITKEVATITKEVATITNELTTITKEVATIFHRFSPIFAHIFFTDFPLVQTIFF